MKGITVLGWGLVSKGFSEEVALDLRPPGASYLKGWGEIFPSRENRSISRPWCGCWRNRKAASVAAARWCVCVGRDGNEGAGGRKVGFMLLVRGLGVCAEWAIWKFYGGEWLDLPSEGSRVCLRRSEAVLYTSSFHLGDQLVPETNAVWNSILVK